jgi:flagellar motility protein MotE (MotC chaperone)
MQEHKRSADKQRLFSEFNAGRVRIVIGSSDTMGTGVNAQARLVALHHLDVPWLPSHIEQREGRIERQGNQNEEIRIYAYATLGSMDATMWQNNERKMRFISAALSGDRSIRTLEDIGADAVNQFAMAKAIASGDSRLLQKAGLETEIARLIRQRDAHLDDQIAVQRRLNRAKREREEAERLCREITADLAQRVNTRGDAFTMTCEKHIITDRRKAGAMLLSRLHSATAPAANIGNIGGFDLSAFIDKRWGERETLLVIERNGGGHEFRITEDTTPLGLISRIEHHLERFDDELAEQQRRASEAARRQAGYDEIGTKPFPLQAELDAKEAELASLNQALAQAGKEATA